MTFSLLLPLALWSGLVLFGRGTWLQRALAR
jgi:hypothetical protein